MLNAKILLNVETDSSGNPFYTLQPLRDQYFSVAQVCRTLCANFTTEDLKCWLSSNYCDKRPYLITLGHDELYDLFKCGLPRVACHAEESKLNDFDYFKLVIGSTFIHVSVVLSLFVHFEKKFRFPKLFQGLIRACDSSVLPLENETRSACYKALTFKQKDWARCFQKYGGKLEDWPALDKIRYQNLYKQKERQKFKGLPEPHWCRRMDWEEIMINYDSIDKIIDGYIEDRPHNLSTIFSSTIRTTKMKREELANPEALIKPLVENDILELQTPLISENGLPGDIWM